MPPPSWLLGVLVLLFCGTHAAGSDPCNHLLVPPHGLPVSACAPPWGHESDPVAGLHAVVVSVGVGVEGLAATPATVATVNGGSVSVEATTAVYTLEYITQGGDEEWPWSGLDVFVSLSNATHVVAVVNTTLVVGSQPYLRTDMEALASGSGRGVCMGDVDGDGDVDVVATIQHDAHQLWLNNGTSGFVDVAGAWGLVPAAAALFRGCTFVDINSDGLLDVYVAAQGSQSALFRNVGQGFVREAVGVVSSSQLGVFGDVDGDGDVDVYVVNTAAVNFLLLGDGAGGFQDVAAARGVNVTGTSNGGAAMVDIDGDGDVDIVEAVANDPNLLFINDGGQFTEAGAAWGFDAESSGSVGVLPFDANMDGLPDLFVPNFGRASDLFVNTGASSFSPHVLVPPSASAQGAAVVDFDLDGDTDVFLGSLSSGGTLLSNAGDSSFISTADVYGIVATGAYGVAAGDLDGDGDVDVVVAEAGRVYMNSAARGSTPRSVTVRPLTAAGAQSAFGAAVRVACVVGCDPPAWVGARWIDGGSGLWSQGGYDAVVGVPAPSASYNVSVRWAGGVHPAATWGTHPRLGGIVPAALPQPSQRLFVVRHAVTVSLGIVPAWDYEFTEDAPEGGYMVSIPLTLFPPANAQDVVIEATVAAYNASGPPTNATVVVLPDGSGAVEYTTSGEDTDWPWAGFSVKVVAEDSAGLRASAVSAVVPGVSLSEELGLRGGTNFMAADGRGVCVADVDGDGFVDVFLAVDGAQDQLWMNVVGLFSDQAPTRGIITLGTASTGCAFGDLDGDGDVDLVVMGLGDEYTQYTNDGGGFFTSAQVSKPSYVNAGVSLGDVEGDGDIDMFSCAQTGVGVLSINDGTGVFSSSTVTGALDSSAAALVDVNGDTALDLVVAQASIVLLLNGGQSPPEFTAAPPAVFPSSVGGGAGLAVSDVNSDGLVDIVASGGHDPTITIFLNGADGTFSVHSLDLLADSAAILAVDVESDGDIDIFVTKARNEAFAAFVNVGHSPPVFSDEAAALRFGPNVGDTLGAAACDIDNDGDVDMLVTGGYLFVNRNALSGTPRSVTVRPLTAAGAQSAFGAAVRMACVVGCDPPAWVGARWIDGGSGAWSQGGYDAVVGVPAPSASYNVSVRWAGGVHPAATWGTHPRLGGIVPAALPQPSQRLFVVRHAPPVFDVCVSEVLPWSDPLPPPAGTTVSLTVTLPAMSNAGDLMITGTLVNGVEGQDSAGLRFIADGRTVPGSTAATVGTLPPGGEVCMGDVDGDGNVDVMVLHANASQLFINNGSASFTEAAEGWGLSRVRASGCAFGDADGDGLLDVFVMAPAGNALLHNSGSAFVEANLTLDGGLGLGDAAAAAWGDVTGTGAQDLYVSRRTSPNSLYVAGGGRSNHTTSMAWCTCKVATTCTCEVWFAVDDACQHSVTVDVELDGWTAPGLVSAMVVNGVPSGDASFPCSPSPSAACETFEVCTEDFPVASVAGNISIAMSTSEKALGPCRFNDALRARVFLTAACATPDDLRYHASAGASRGAASALTSRAVVLGDIDGDADLDIVVGNAGLDEVFVNDGRGVFGEAAAALGVVNPGVTVGLLLGDLTGDGLIDFFAVNYGSAGVLFEGSPSGVFVQWTVGDAATCGAQAVDVEGDGDLDIAVGSLTADTVVYVDACDGGLLPEGGRGLDVAGGAQCGLVPLGVSGDGSAAVLSMPSGVVASFHPPPQWLSVRVLGARGGLSAHGAVVRVSSSGWRAVRVVGASGYDVVVGLPPGAARPTSV